MKLKVYLLASLLAAFIGNSYVAATNNLRAIPSKKTNLYHGDGQDEAARRRLALSSGLLSFKYPSDVTQYLTLASDGWATSTTVKDHGTKFTKYVDSGKTYYKVTSGNWKDYYLSYSKYGYLGAYKSWNDAGAWAPFKNCLTVDGTSWGTFVYHQSYVVVDDQIESGYENICMNWEG